MSATDDKSSDVSSLTVHGMTCAGCSKTVERVLLQVPGVLGAVVDFAAKQALIRGRFDPEAAIVSLRAAGFEGAVATARSDWLS